MSRRTAGQEGRARRGIGNRIGARARQHGLEPHLLGAEAGRGRHWRRCARWCRGAAATRPAPTRRHTDCPAPSGASELQVLQAGQNVVADPRLERLADQERRRRRPAGRDWPSPRVVVKRLRKSASFSGSLRVLHVEARRDQLDLPVDVEKRRACRQIEGGLHHLEERRVGQILRGGRQVLPPCVRNRAPAARPRPGCRRPPPASGARSGRRCPGGWTSKIVVVVPNCAKLKVSANSLIALVGELVGKAVAGSATPSVRTLRMKALA